MLKLITIGDFSAKYNDVCGYNIYRKIRCYDTFIGCFSSHSEFELFNTQVMDMADFKDLYSLVSQCFEQNKYIEDSSWQMMESAPRNDLHLIEVLTQTEGTFRVCFKSFGGDNGLYYTEDNRPVINIIRWRHLTNDQNKS